MQTIINGADLDVQARHITKRELAIADAAVKEGRALVIVPSKIDSLAEKDHAKEDCVNDAQRQLGMRFPFFKKCACCAYMLIEC